MRFEANKILAIMASAVEETLPISEPTIFAAGSLVVWDVDLLSRDSVKVYCATNPKNPRFLPAG